MNKLLVAALTTAVSLVSSPLWAQAKNFQGFALSGGLHLSYGKLQQSNLAGTADDNATTNAGTLQVQLEYTLAREGRFAFALGGSASLGDLYFGKGRFNTHEVKLTSQYSAYAAPGYTLNKDTLLYGKVALHRADVQNESTNRVNGVGLGGGAKFLDGKNRFYQVELLSSHYTDALNTSANNQLHSTSMLFAMGYKF